MKKIRIEYIFGIILPLIIAIGAIGMHFWRIDAYKNKTAYLVFANYNDADFLNKSGSHLEFQCDDKRLDENKKYKPVLMVSKTTDIVRDQSTIIIDPRTRNSVGQSVFVSIHYPKSAKPVIPPRVMNSTTTLSLINSTESDNFYTENWFIINFLYEGNLSIVWDQPQKYVVVDTYSINSLNLDKPIGGVFVGKNVQNQSTYSSTIDTRIKDNDPSVLPVYIFTQEGLNEEPLRSNIIIDENFAYDPDRLAETNLNTSLTRLDLNINPQAGFYRYRSCKDIKNYMRFTLFDPKHKKEEKVTLTEIQKYSLVRGPLAPNGYELLDSSESSDIYPVVQPPIDHYSGSVIGTEFRVRLSGEKDISTYYDKLYILTPIGWITK